MGMKDPQSGGVYVDCWHIPGGGIENGEDKKIALQREVMEESGIDISAARIELADDKGRGETEKTLKDSGEKVLCKMQFNVYKVSIDAVASNIEVHPNDDLIKLEWIDLEHISDYKLTPPSLSLFTRLGYL